MIQPVAFRILRAARAAAVAATALATLAIGCSDGSPTLVSRGSAASQAYVFGFPLVVTMRTLQTFSLALPLNSLTWQAALSGPTSRVIVAPNVDTLYAIAPVDLRGEPFALTIPEIRDRYYSFQMIGAYTDSFFYVGTRATAARAGTWVITPPGWTGELPAGVEQVESPTPQFFLLGRFGVSGQDDVPNVHALRDSVRFEPLSALTGGSPAPPPPGFGPPAGTPQDIASAGVAFFDELGDALSVNPPSDPRQQQLLDRFARLGVGPGRHPSEEIDDAAQLAELAAGVEEGEATIQARIDDNLDDRAWPFRTDLGTYGDDDLLRAVVAKVGWGANVAAEALYATSDGPIEGGLYSGARRYVLRFEPGELPPVDAFWSLTLYGPDRFLVANTANRYAIGDRTPGLVYGADGSLEILIQHDPPAGREANWLPAPEDAFQLMMRLYLPRAEAIDGQWVGPDVRDVGPAA